MPIKPRYVFPLNFREQDKEILDAAILLAKEEGSDLTGIMREALRQFTDSKKSKMNGGLRKMDEFLEDG